MGRSGRSRSPGADRKEKKAEPRKRVFIPAGPATPTYVVDTHVYIMPPFDGANGANLARLQAEVGLSPTFTLQMETGNARFVEGSGLLLNPETRILREAVTWSRDELSRLIWHVDGKRYLKGYLPAHVAVQGGAYTTEQLVAAMDVTDVALSILTHSPAFGDVTPLHREAIQRFPRRFRRLVAIPSLSSTPAQLQAAINRIEAEVNFGGVVGFQFFTGSFEGDWLSDEMAPFWDYLQKRKLSVWFTIMPSTSTRLITSAEEAFKADFDKIVTWCSKYEEMDAIITHGLPWRSYLHSDRKGIGPLPKWVFKAADCPRLYLQLCLPACIGDVFDFPYKEVNTMIERLAKRIGASRLLYGTQMPSLERFCTYSQSVRQIFTHFDFMTAEERALVLGGNAGRLLAAAEERPMKLQEIPPCWKELPVPVLVPALLGQSVETLQTPCLVVDLDLFEVNCKRLVDKLRPSNSEAAAQPGVKLRPRMEAHKCADLGRLQLEALGDLATGLTCQSVRQAEAAVRCGVQDVMVNVILSDELKVSRVVSLAAAGARVTVCIESKKSLASLKQVLSTTRGANTIDVMLDLGAAARCGAEGMSLDTAVTIAATVEGASGLQLKGLQVYLPPTANGREEMLGMVRSHVGALREAGYSKRFVVSSEDVERWPLADLTIEQEIQCGSSVFQGAELRRPPSLPSGAMGGASQDSGALDGSSTNGKQVPPRPPRLTVTCRIDCPELGMSWNVVSQSKTQKLQIEESAESRGAASSQQAPTAGAASAAAVSTTAQAPPAQSPPAPEAGSSMDEDSSDDDDEEMEAGAGTAQVNGATDPADSIENLRGPAMFVLGTVVGSYTASCMVDVGLKALAPPCGEISVAGQAEGQYNCLGDDYGSVIVTNAQACPEVGSRLRQCPEHTDATAGLHDFIVAVRKGVVQASYNVNGRGN